MMRDLPGPNDTCGEHPDFYDDGRDECPFCGGFHDADDNLCPAIPSDEPEIHEEDIDWDDWIGQVA